MIFYYGIFGEFGVNVIFTLLFGLLTILIYDKYNEYTAISNKPDQSALAKIINQEVKNASNDYENYLNDVYNYCSCCCNNDRLEEQFNDSLKVFKEVTSNIKSDYLLSQIKNNNKDIDNLDSNSIEAWLQSKKNK